jgi:hypothetical protein
VREPAGVDGPPWLVVAVVIPPLVDVYAVALCQLYLDFKMLPALEYYSHQVAVVYHAFFFSSPP